MLAQQVATTHDVGNPLRSVVHDDGQLVRHDAIATSQDKIADRCGDVAGVQADAAISKTDVTRAHAKAQRRACIARGVRRHALGWVEQLVPAGFLVACPVLGQACEH